MCLQYKSFENTVGKEKLLLMRNFSFFHNVYYPFGELFAMYIKYKLSPAKYSVWKSLKFEVWERVKDLKSSLLYNFISFSVMKALDPHTISLFNISGHLAAAIMPVIPPSLHPSMETFSKPSFCP